MDTVYSVDDGLVVVSSPDTALVVSAGAQGPAGPQGPSGTIAVNTGFVACTVNNTTFAGRTLQGSTGLSISNPAGLAGDPVFSLAASLVTLSTALIGAAGLLLLGAADAAAAKTTLGLNNVENVALSTWAGSSNLTTLGTINTGVWHGTVIGSQYGGTGQNFSAATGYLKYTAGVASAVATIPFGDISGVPPYQPLDGTLTALAAYNTNGFLVQTAADTFAGRTLTGTASRILITNGDGVSGNPVINIDTGYVGQTSITTLGTITTGVWNAGSVTSSGTGQFTNIGVGVAPNTAYGVYVASSALTGIDQAAFRAMPTFSSAATTVGYCYYSAGSTQAAAFTMASYYHYFATTISKGSGSTITDLVGFQVANQTAGTNNYGFVSALSSGGNKWNFFSVGTANNAFVGFTTFGSAGVPTAQVDLSGNTSAASWTVNGIGIRLRGNTYTDSSTAISGTAGTNHIHTIAVPTLAATNATVTTTTSATLYIAGAPTAGTNMTITNGRALLVAAGVSEFAGSVVTTSLALPAQTASSMVGPLNIGGNLGYSDTGIQVSIQASTNSYIQQIMRNTSNAAAASANYIVSNDVGTASTFYGEFGMNSSGFTGTGSFNQASAVYLASTSADLVIGTTTANVIKFVINSGTTDAAQITSTGYQGAIGATTANTAVFTNVGVGSAQVTSIAVLVGSTNLTGTLPAAFQASPVFPSTATNSGFGFYSSATTANTAFTMTNLRHFYAETVTKGAASTITNVFGFQVADQTAGANNYGFVAGLSSGSNKWNIYASGTAPNYFAGNIGVGILPTTNALILAANSGTLTGTFQRAFATSFAVNSAATLYGAALVCDIGTVAGSYTVSDLYGVLVQAGSQGAGTTITRNTGVQVADLTTGASNYGVRIGLSAGSGKWNLYADGTANSLFVGFVGLGTQTPAAQLDISDISGLVAAASWGNSGIGLRIRANTYRDTSTAISGTATTNHIHAIAAPNLNATNATVTTTTSATLYIAGAPVQGANMTITNPLSLLVGAGISRFDGLTYHANGTNGAPSIAFTSDIDTGFRWDSANRFTAVVGGTQHTFFQDDGFLLQRTYSGSLNFFIDQLANTGTDNAAVVCRVASATAGDAKTTYTVFSVATWEAGLDNSDSDAYVISNAALGTSNVLRLTSTTATLASTVVLGWGSTGTATPDVLLAREGANILAQRNSTSAQAFKVYNTTNGTDIERGGLIWSGNILYLGTEAAGAGSNRDLALNVPTGRQLRYRINASDLWLMNATAFYPAATGTMDIGASGAGIRSLYVDFTNTATVGAVTISKASGRVNIAAGGSSVVVTNTLVATTTRAFANLAGAQDATARSVQCDCSTPGQITIRLGTVCTAGVAIDFFIVN